jgi:hypothetical protein
VIDHAAIRARFEALDPLLDERARRRLAAAEALTAGWGGIAAVSEITGVARSTIGRGLVELREGETTQPDRVRRPGGGRKPLTAKDPALVPVGNSRSDILVMEAAQYGQGQRLTGGLDGARDRRVFSQR